MTCLRYEGTLVTTVNGQWCDTCQLPSAYLLHVVITPRSNPTWVAARLTIHRCDDCGERHVEPTQRSSGDT